MNKYKTEGVDKQQFEKSVYLIKKMFSNRMLVIDEVHNIRDLKPLKGEKKKIFKINNRFVFKISIIFR